jgi:hypothetical protein
MKSSDSTIIAAEASALGALEGWLESLHGEGGYYGPVVGMRGAAMTWCGPAHDWRWEGLLDGWVARHRHTADPACLAPIDQAFRDLQAAQLADGSFLNSYFEHNPMEGGMPHEPAVMAAVLRAGRYLRERGREWPDGTASMLERFVEKRLLKALWNKTLRTFNTWPQSDFEIYSPPALASIVETLIEYAHLTGMEERWTPYIAGTAESLLKSQFRDGPLAGALPVSSTDRTSASPYLAARCLPALMLLHHRSGDGRFADAGDRLADFVKRGFQAGGGIACLAFAGRPDRIAPLYTGATAGALSALTRTGRMDEALWKRQFSWLLALQSDTGGFDTAVGYGTDLPRRTPPDWRDALPVCGWAAHIFALLANRVLAPAPGKKTDAGVVRRAVRVRGRQAEMMEDADTIAIRNHTEPLYIWRKRTVWPEVCLL